MADKIGEPALAEEISAGMYGTLTGTISRSGAGCSATMSVTRNPNDGVLSMTVTYMAGDTEVMTLPAGSQKGGTSYTNSFIPIPIFPDYTVDKAVCRHTVTDGERYTVTSSVTW